MHPTSSFLRAVWLAGFLSVRVAIPSGEALEASQDRSAQLRACEWCGADEAPANLTWRVTIADEMEPGDPLILRGVVYAADGATPVPNVLLYMYHTNDEGVYPRRGNETGNGPSQSC